MFKHIPHSDLRLIAGGTFGTSYTPLIDMKDVGGDLLFLFQLLLILGVIGSFFQPGKKLRFVAFFCVYSMLLTAAVAGVVLAVNTISEKLSAGVGGIGLLCAIVYGWKLALLKAAHLPAEK